MNPKIIVTTMSVATFFLIIFLIEFLMQSDISSALGIALVSTILVVGSFVVIILVFWFSQSVYRIAKYYANAVLLNG